MPDGTTTVKVQGDVMRDFRRFKAQRELITGERLTASDAIAMLLKTAATSLTLREPPIDVSEYPDD